MRNKLTVLISVAVCAIMVTAAILPNLTVNERSSDDTDYSKVINVSDNSFTDRLSQVADALAETCNTEINDSGDVIITGSPTISDIFPELNFDDSSMDLSIVERDDTYTYSISSQDTDLNSDNVNWEYVYDDDGELIDIIAITDSGRLSIKEQYDTVEECEFITLTVIAVVFVVAAITATVAAKEISDNNNSNNDDSSDSGNNGVEESRPNVTPYVPPVTPTTPEVVVKSTTGRLNPSIAWDAAKYYSNGSFFKEFSLYFKYCRCYWDEVVNGISISKYYDDRLLAVAVNGDRYSISDLYRDITHMGVNEKDDNSHYFAVVVGNNTFILPKEITFSQAQGVMLMEYNDDGLVSTWTRSYDSALEVASVNGPAVGPEVSYHEGYYYHFHTYKRATEAHSFYGGPVL